MGLIFLVPLSTSSHTVLQSFLHLLSFLGVAEYWDGKVKITGPSMSPEVAVLLGEILPQLLVSWSLSVPVVHADAWRAPKFSLVPG